MAILRAKNVCPCIVCIWTEDDFLRSTVFGPEEAFVGKSFFFFLSFYLQRKVGGGETMESCEKKMKLGEK